MLKKLIAALFLSALLTPLASAELIVPNEPSSYVLDEADILSYETEQELEARLYNLDVETSNQIVVVTMNDLQGYSIEEAALTIGRTWGVGQEEFNNGLVFLIAPNEREARIEVGYGLEGAITDAQSFAIVDEAVSYFSYGDYDSGALQAVYHLEQLARGEYFDLAELADDEYDVDDYLGGGLFAIIFLWLFASWFASTKEWFMGGIFGGLIGYMTVLTLTGIGVGLGLGLLADFLISKYLYKKIKFPYHWFLSGGSGGGSGGGFGGGSGGGFGGFGGGSFGGGGATGRW